MYAFNFSKLWIFFFILLVLSIATFSLPEMPMIIDGKAYINEKPAQEGTKVSAFADGKEIYSAKTDSDGKFSLLIQKINEGTQIEIRVDGIKSDNLIQYKSGDFKILELSVERKIPETVVIVGIIALIIIIIGVLIALWLKKSRRKK